MFRLFLSSHLIALTLLMLNAIFRYTSLCRQLPADFSRRLRWSKRVYMLHRIFFFLIFISLFPVVVGAQQPDISSPDTRIGRVHSHEDPTNESQQEMAARAAIKREENSYRENLDRAKENARLAVELRDTFAHNKSLTLADLKKLGRMEKLARHIRSDAGGSADDDPIDDPPRELEAALTSLASLSENLRKEVEKTPRHVISAAVIERANSLLQLIHYIRGLTGVRGS